LFWRFQSFISFILICTNTAGHTKVELWTGIIDSWTTLWWPKQDIFDSSTQQQKRSTKT